MESVDSYSAHQRKADFIASSTYFVIDWHGEAWLDGVSCWLALRMHGLSTDSVCVPPNGKKAMSRSSNVDCKVDVNVTR